MLEVHVQIGNLVYHLDKIRIHWHTKTAKIRTHWHSKKAEKATLPSGTSLAFICPKVPPPRVATEARISTVGPLTSHQPETVKYSLQKSTQV